MAHEAIELSGEGMVTAHHATTHSIYMGPPGSKEF